MVFEYDEQKSLLNLEKHGTSFKNAALVFLDYNRIEFFDKAHSDDEDRYQTIGAIVQSEHITGESFSSKGSILFVVYTEREAFTENGKYIDITRIISAREATGFERGIYYGNYH